MTTKEYAVYCTPLKNGKFKYRQRYADPLLSTPEKTVTKAVYVTLTKNTKQAESKAREILAEKIAIKLNDASNGSNVTFGKIANEYKKIAKKRLAYTTYYSKSSSLSKIVASIGENTLAAKLTTQYFNRFFDDLLYGDTPLSNATITSYKSIINQCYEGAVRHGLLSENPIKDVKINYKSEVQKRRNEIERKYFEESELTVIFDDIRKVNRPDIADILEFQVKTGMRIGEVSALQKKNIIKHGDDYYARVTGDLYQVRKPKPGTKAIRKSKGAKNATSNRDVLLSPSAQKIALRLIKNKKADDYIFKNNRSPQGFFKPTKLDLFLKGVKKRTKIDKIFTTHTFRHSYISILAQKGVPLQIIQQQTGHSNSRIISQIYLHITQKAKEDFANKLKEINF
ncbi:site-specific integrase [Lactobacillus intestinalis]|uniref:tyrosine-type recombinase/integrase n=1 Tax=Lactobacillus intestinalis TaxID=151781 RepID=UPI0026EB88E8|nr:site-specific integrase [Lactobacillus intestinalis]